MKERPILFSGPMVRAILEGRKTMTRRVVQGLPAGIKCASALPESGYQYRFTDFKQTVVDRRCPYGRPPVPLEPSDRLWVRETAKIPLAVPNSAVLYRADNHIRPGLGDFEAEAWKPSIFMPRWASRITLEIKEVRVEQLQDISERDIAAEGLTVTLGTPCATAFTDLPTGIRIHSTAMACFAAGWNALNKKRDYGWSTNPWVWVITFEVDKQ